MQSDFLVFWWGKKFFVFLRKFLDWHFHHTFFISTWYQSVLGSQAFPSSDTFRINVPHEKATYFLSLFPLIFNRIKFRSVFFFLFFLKVLRLCLRLSFHPEASSLFPRTQLMSMSLFSHEKCFFPRKKKLLFSFCWRGKWEAIVRVLTWKMVKVIESTTTDSLRRASGRKQGQVWLEIRIITRRKFPSHFLSRKKLVRKSYLT